MTSYKLRLSKSAIQHIEQALNDPNIQSVGIMPNKELGYPTGKIDVFTHQNSTTKTF